MQKCNKCFFGKEYGGGGMCMIERLVNEADAKRKRLIIKINIKTVDKEIDY